MQTKSDEEISPPMDPNLKKAFERGIPVSRAVFHAAVNNSEDVPENYFSSASAIKSRNVKMWWVQGDQLLCHHKGKWFGVPASNVIFHKFE